MKKNATGKKASALSREFKEAIDAVFAAEELDEYTVTYSTRMVERIPKDLNRNSMLSETTSSTVSSLPVDDLLEDGSMQMTDAERLVRQLRRRAQANNSSSDAQSLRSRYTINTRSVDTRSRRSSRTTGTGAPSRLSVKGNRLPQRTPRPDRQTISDEKRKARASTSGQSVRSYRKSPNLQGARRSSSRSRARSKSGGTQKTNRRRGKTPPSRRRANSADASKLAPKPTSNTPRSSSSIRARSRTPTGESRAAVVRRGKRSDRSKDEASTVVSRVTRSNRSVRTWHIGQGSSIDPAEFYAREMARLKNKRVSADGLRKEMDDLHQREKRQSAGPPRRSEVQVGSPSREQILPRANQTARRMYAEPISLVPKSATDVDGFSNADRSTLFRMEGTADATPFVTGANTFDEYSHITQNGRLPSRRFPKLGRGLFRRAKSVDRLDRPVDETEQRLLD